MAKRAEVERHCFGGGKVGIPHFCSDVRQSVHSTEHTPVELVVPHLKTRSVGDTLGLNVLVIVGVAPNNFPFGLVNSNGLQAIGRNFGAFHYSTFIESVGVPTTHIHVVVVHAEFGGFVGHPTYDFELPGFLLVTVPAEDGAAVFAINVGNAHTAVENIVVNKPAAHVGDSVAINVAEVVTTDELAGVGIKGEER